MPLGVYPLRRTEPDTAKRPLPTLVIATTFPFTAGEYLDPHGDLWGQNLATGNAVVVDPSQVDPGHMIVVAPTGSGKSFGLKVLATQALLREDEDVLVLDPSEAIDYERWAWVTGPAIFVLAPVLAHGSIPSKSYCPSIRIRWMTICSVRSRARWPFLRCCLE